MQIVLCAVLAGQAITGLRGGYRGDFSGVLGIQRGLVVHFQFNAQIHESWQKATEAKGGEVT